MQQSFNSDAVRGGRRRRGRHGAADSEAAAGRLADLRSGQQGIIERLELPDDIARRLMELGFLPGSRITVVKTAPGGDPTVFSVDGSEIALRRETAAQLLLRHEPPSGD